LALGMVPFTVTSYKGKKRWYQWVEKKLLQGDSV
jgi:hypothetical protein